MAVGRGGLCAAAARRSKTDYIAFDIDDGTGPALGTGVFRQEGENMIAYGNSPLRFPADDGRELVVATGGGDYTGYSASHPGPPLKLVEPPLPDDFDAVA